MNILLLKVGTLTTYLLLSLSIYAERREMIRMFKKEPKAFVFGDKVNLRAEPSKTAKIVTVLPIGTELKIGEIVESPDESDQFAWVQSETKDGKKGYVHETLITVHTLKLKDSKSIYLGIANAATPQYELRLVETNTLLSRLTLPKKYVNFISLTCPRNFGQLMQHIFLHTLSDSCSPLGNEVVGDYRNILYTRKSPIWHPLNRQNSGGS